MNNNIKSNKATTVILSITLPLALIFIVLGSLITAGVFNRNDYNNPNGPGSGSNYTYNLYLNDSKYISNAETYQEYTFNISTTSSGTYYIYIDNCSLSNVLDEYGSSRSTSYQDNYVYYDGTYYDYCYSVYLYSYSDYSIIVKTSSSYNFSIAVTKTAP